MELAQSALLIVALVVMVIALLISFLPIVPGPVLLWMIGGVFAWLNGFDRITVLAVIVMSVLMLTAATKDFWLSLLGVKTSGVSCLGAIGSFIGGLAGTFFIPIPVVGTLIGAVAGALLVELVRVGDLRHAVRAGRFAAKMFVLGYIIEVTVSIAIFAIFVISLISTG